MAKATFCKHFPAKDELVLADVDKTDGIWTGQLRAADPETAHAAKQAAGRLVASALPRVT